MVEITYDQNGTEQTNQSPLCHAQALTFNVQTRHGGDLTQKDQGKNTEERKRTMGLRKRENRGRDKKIVG